MTSADSLLPPRHPSGALRGFFLIMGASIILGVITLLTVDPTLYSVTLVVLSACIIVGYVLAAFITITMWRREHHAWMRKATDWLIAQGVTAAAAEELTTHRRRAPKVEQFAAATYIARIEGPLLDTYFVIDDEGGPALYEAQGTHFAPREPRLPSSAPIW